MSNSNDTVEMAADAIGYVLGRVKAGTSLAWYLGRGTESFDRLTAAYAKLKDQPVEDVRTFFDCRNPINPKGD